MANDLLAALGALTLGGSAAVILFALTARASRRRYAARWRCWIWALLCLRMAVPVSLLSLGGGEGQAPIRLELPPDTVVYEYTPTEPDGGVQAGTLSPARPSPGAEPTGSQTGEDTPASAGEPKFSISLSEIAALIWLAGVVVMALWALVSHLRFLRWLRRWARPAGDPGVIRLYNQTGDQLGLNRRPDLRLCTGLRAPMLAGLFHPALLLPEERLGEGSDTMRYILIHELTHYKRRDILVKALALLANIVHWFNPFMWYMVRLVERDTELACDEAALRRLPPEDHAAYGRTILNAAERLKRKPEN